MNNVYLLLGSNLSDPLYQIELARNQIEKHIGNIKKQSSIYQTAAWGKTDQPDFFNQVLFIKSDLKPEKILEKIFEIERKMGRLRSEKNAPRIIDIDILFYNDAIIHTENLTIPHPALQFRRFVLVPMEEIAHGYIHPILNKTIHELLLQCTDELNVKRF